MPSSLVPSEASSSLTRKSIAHISASWALRLFFASFMAMSAILTGWAGIASQASAASQLRNTSVARPVQTTPSQPTFTGPYHLPYAIARSGNSVLQSQAGPGVKQGSPGEASTNTGSSLSDHELTAGEQPYFTLQKWQVNDHLTVAVNVASGNLVVHANDLHIQGTGVDETIDRFYNPIGTNDQTSDLSQHWNLSAGSDVYLQFNTDNSITYYSPSGTPFVFTSAGSGNYNSPAGINATLTTIPGDTDGAYHLDFHKNKETYEFGSAGHLIDDEDKNGNHIVYNETNGKVDTITDTQGRTTTFSYDTSGRLITITDPSGRKVQYTYDINGNLASSTDTLGQKTTYSYVEDDDLSQITDPAGHVIKIAYSTTSIYDEVTSLTDATGAVTKFAYTENSDGTNTTVMTDPRNHNTTYQSNNHLRVNNVTDALNHSQSTTYTPNNDVSSLQDSLGDTSKFAFDTKNNITSSTDATNATNSLTYNDSAHPYFPDTSQDTQGNYLAYTYDSPGNLKSVKNVTTGGAGETTSYSYNSNGTLATMKDGNGNTTSYSYDSNGNLTKITPPSPLGATTIQRDSLSRATSVTDGKGQMTSFTYDALDRISKVTYADGSVVSYIRDAAGNVTSQTDNTGTTSFTYDGDNRILTKSIPGGVTITMAYGQSGNLISYTDQGGTVTYSYNTVNLLTTLTEPGGANTTFSYDSNNRRTGVTYPNGVTMSLTYDKAGRETGVTASHAGTTLSGYTYKYGGGTSSVDLRTSMTDQVLGQTTSYSYDKMNRLLGATTTQGSTQVNQFNYTYDSAGNRSKQTINGTQTTYTYNAANQLTTTSQGVNYSYDANGNLTNISTGNETLTYNAKDQSTSINNVSMNYSGADQNQRVQAGGTSYTNSPLGVSSQTSGGSTTYYTRDNSGSLIDERTSTGTYYYLFDGLGSVVGLSDSTGNLVGNERYQYDPYGNLLKAPVASQLQTNIWRFASGQFDSGTGLTKFGVRYYDPSVGRWTQQDPKGGCLSNPKSSNRYVYAACDPVNNVDLNGKDARYDCIRQCLTNQGLGILAFSILGVISGFGLIAGAALTGIALSCIQQCYGPIPSNVIWD